jgi:hypothetical protein
MIVILGINDRGDLIRSLWTRLFKRGQLKSWDIAQQTPHQIWAALPFHLAPLRIPGLPTRLMKGNITSLLITFGLGRNIHIIKCIGKTIMAIFYGDLFIIAFWIKEWF